MQINVGKREIFFGYIAQFLSIGSGVLIIPIAVSHLSAEYMGLWYVFVALFSMAQLFEFGYQQTVVRQTAYVYSGCERLSLSTPSHATGNINIQLLNSLVQASRLAFRKISLLSVFFYFALGSIYLYSLVGYEEEVFISWFLYALANSFNTYYTYMNAMITGRGEQRKVFVVTSLSKMSLLLVSAVFLYLGYGLISMAIGTLVSTLLNRLLISRVFYNDPYIDKSIEMKKNRDYCGRILWELSKKIGLASVGSFFINRANIFIVSSFIGVKSTASYGLTMQLILVSSSLCGMMFYINVPRLNSLQTKQDTDAVIVLFKMSLKKSLILFFIACVIIYTLGPNILILLSNDIEIVSSTVLIMMLISWFLDLNHSICATFLTTKNIIPSPIPIVMSGVLIVVISYFVVNYTQLGILGVVLTQFVVQLCFNNWYWPLRVYRILK